MKKYLLFFFKVLFLVILSAFLVILYTLVSNKRWNNKPVEISKIEVPKGNKAGDTYLFEARRNIKQKISISFSWIPSGTFVMGKNYDSVSIEKETNEKFYRGEDFPEHPVHISRGFWMSRYEITQRQWEAIMENNSFFRNAEYPVETVSLARAHVFAEKLSNLVENGRFRIPTEAEWEYACRAGTDTLYYWGNEINEDYLWYSANSNGTTHPGGLKKPNNWGLYDMSGNVWEWVTDVFSPRTPDSLEFISTDPVCIEPRKWSVSRGGCYYDSRRECMSYTRAWPFDNMYPSIGIRLVLEVAGN